MVSQSYVDFSHVDLNRKTYLFFKNLPVRTSSGGETIRDTPKPADFKNHHLLLVLFMSYITVA